MSTVYTVHARRGDHWRLKMNRVVLGVIAVALFFPLAAAVADDSDAGEPGILISRVIEDSPAQKAGILRGDIILEVEIDMWFFGLLKKNWEKFARTTHQTNLSQVKLKFPGGRPLLIFCPGLSPLPCWSYPVLMLLSGVRHI